MIVNRSTGEVVGRVKSRKRRFRVLTLILLSLLLAATATLAWHEHDRAQKAVVIAHQYQELYKAAEESINDEIAKQITLSAALKKAQAAGYQPNFTEKYLMLTPEAAKNEQAERSKKSVELAALLNALK